MEADRNFSVSVKFRSFVPYFHFSLVTLSFLCFNCFCIFSVFNFIFSRHFLPCCYSFFPFSVLCFILFCSVLFTSILFSSILLYTSFYLSLSSRAAITDATAPKPFPAASGKRVLTMEYLRGTPLIDLEGIRKYR